MQHRERARHGKRSRGVKGAAQTVAGVTAVLLAAAGLPAVVAPAAAAPIIGQGFTLNAGDITFILKQIKIAEAHAASATAANPCGTLLGGGANQLPATPAAAELPWGLRTVDGTCNNLLPGKVRLGAADNTFPRTAKPPVFRDAEERAPFGAPGATSYKQKTGAVVDSQPRVASNLIVDQTVGNPAAVAAANLEGPLPPAGETLFIRNAAPDVGLSAPFNGMFTLFGQFFDHGLDLTNKSGGTVFMPLKADDPLIAESGSTPFMVLTRSTNQAGPDGILGNADDVQDATNQTTPVVDQSQTYTSHPSHQVFLREYANNAAGKPVATGKLLTGADGGLATWKSVKDQSRTLLGIELRDADVLNLPLLATDQYGKFTPGSNGLPQLVVPSAGTPTVGLVQGSTATPTVTTGATQTGHAFLDDIAHHAVPKPAQPSQGPGRPARAALTPDTNTDITPANGTQDPGTYDDEMLDAHFTTGDGRTNENIGLSAVHQVFHSEHNRLTTELVSTIPVLTPGTVGEWKLPDGSWNGERLFQAARFVTEMEYQHLAFEEFARKVQPMVNLFAGYDTSVDPAISAEFAHAVYRFGHSMLTETVARRSPSGGNRDIPLLDAFLNPPAYAAGGLTPEQATGDIVRGMTDQVGNEIDEFVTDALRNRLLGLPLDLAALNMARGREAGIPSLNGSRRQFQVAAQGSTSLAPYTDWTDFSLGIRHAESLINFVAAYGRHPSVVNAPTAAAKRAAAALIVAGDITNPDTPVDSAAFLTGAALTQAAIDVRPSTPTVTMTPHSTWVSGADGVTKTGVDDIDLWVGGLAEKQAPFGGLLGSTFNYVFETQMENLQDGDRFYYLTRTAGLNLLVQLEGNSFAELITRNTDVSGLPADVFSRPDYKFDLSKVGTSGPILDDPDTDYDERILLTRMTDGTVRFAGGEHVVFNGSPGNDKARSSEGDDTMRGNDGDDRMEGGTGNDHFIGGEGADILTDAFGDDVLKGGGGHDAMSSGPGFDLNQGGLGNDFVIGGSDPTETFGGPGNDMIFGGDSTDTVFGDDGDDWIEGGGQADLLQGDNGAPFQDDPNAPGHDVINGNGGADDYDSEGGDDIMVAGPGVERNEGMLGFDWVTHKNDPTKAEDDLNFTGLLPPAADTLRDRFDAVEALSGWNLDDDLRGDSLPPVVGVDPNSLDIAGIGRITGLAALLPFGSASFTGSNILLGGGGSDRLEGRGGDDVLDGDAWLDVQLRTGTERVDSMGALQARVFAGTLNPGNIEIVRSIALGTGGTDVAVFTQNRADYDISTTGGVTTVTHARGTLVDGTDRVRNVETLTFADGSIPPPPAATTPGAPTVGIPVAGNAFATVSWLAPADNGGAAITRYEVLVLNGAGVPTGRVEIVAATARNLRVTGLTNGTAYSFAVRAVNSVGAGALSLDSSAVTPRASIPAATPPDRPTNVRAFAGNQSATVRWTAPLDDGRSPITGYSIQTTRVSNGNVDSTLISQGPGTQFVVPGLRNDRSYTFRVRAINQAGTGRQSARSTAVSPSTNPPPITVAEAPIAAPPLVPVTDPPPVGTPVTPPVVTPPVVTPPATTAPGAPVIGRPEAGASARAPITATANWAPPASTGGSPITGYQVFALQLGVNDVIVATTTSAVLPATARSLEMTFSVAARYSFQVVAINAAGTSQRSAISRSVRAR